MRSFSTLAASSFAVSVSTLVALPTFASDWVIDSAHSNVKFTVRHLVSKVSGSFNDFSGTVAFDEKKPEAAKTEMTVKTESINTGNSNRDDHLRSPDFFDTKKFPTMTFKTGKFTPAGKNTYKLVGEMTMHGVTKPVTYDVEYLGAAKDMEGKTRAGFTATTKINRKDFGLNWGKMVEGVAMVGDEVNVEIQIEAVQAAVTAKKAE